MPNTHSTLTSLFTDIANVLRSKTGSNAEIQAIAFPSAIANLPTGSISVSGNISITNTGIYDIASFSIASVNVSAQDLFYAKVQNGFNSAIFYDSSLTKVWSGTFPEDSTIKSFSLPACTEVGEAAFWYCKASEYSIPDLTSIGSRAFCGASITSANFSLCSYIGESAFYQCLSLTTASFSSSLSEIPYYAFAWNSKLTAITATGVTSIGSSAFQNCYALNSVNFSNCVFVGTSAFYNCSHLASINLPNINYIYSNTFRYCSSLTSVTFPEVSTIGTSAFANCLRLSYVNLSKLTNISSYAFSMCNNLISVYLTNSVVATLASTTVFTSTPISNYTTSTGGVYGSIYVPASLYDAYISATNWSVYSSRFVSI